MEIKNKHILMSAVLFSAMNAFPVFAGTLSTSIELKNNTSSDKMLISENNTTGDIFPSLPNPIPANRTASFTSSSNGAVDAGVLTYQQCRFNWSVIELGTIYKFSIGAEPSSRCSSEILVQNVFTGEYKIKFNIDG